MSENKKSGFGSDIIFKTISELISAALGVVTFSIFAIYLPKGNYAVVNQFISVGALIAPIILVKMNNAFCVFLSNENDKKILKSRFVSVSLITVGISAVILLSMLLLQEKLSILMFDDPQYSYVVPYMAIYYILLSFSTLCQDFYRAIRRIKKTSIIIIIKTIITTVAFYILTRIGGFFTVNNVLLIYSLIELVIAIYCFISVMHLLRGEKLELQFTPLKEYYKYSLPLMPCLIMSWVNGFIGRFMLNHLMDLESSAIYSFNASLVSRLFFLNTVIGYTVFPYISKYWNEGKKHLVEEYLSKGYKIGISIGIPLTIGVVITAPTLIMLLSDGKYEVDKLLLTILCIGNIFLMMYTTYASLIDLSRKTILYNVIFLVSSVLNIVLNYLLIPIFDIYGVAIATLITYLVQMILTIIIGSKSAKLSIRLDWKYSLKCLVASIIMGGCVIVLYRNAGILSFTISVTLGILVYGIVMIFLDREIRDMITQLIKRILHRT